ncbi:alpha/beta-hydrolase [Calocera cornea HHB12733]|uniref:Alpha/beta-hydrolase n=1 Tax=Calocera cornea HHB12733 TaxID=1353952 RepID=A0A165FHG4_9BASI|nr:alpha/beta-hydrolase [Calocera cornea HHB12733]
MAVPRSLILTLALAAAAFAAPLVPRKNEAPVSPLSAAQVSSITPFAWFTNAAYCSHAAVMSWSCGSACSSLPGVEVILTGGDNGATPDYYVAYYPADGAIVVSTQGTTTDNILSLIDDGEANLTGLDQNYFPGTSGMEVHDGFQATFERSASTILAAVESGISTYGASQVYVVGHSLGAAVGLLNALYLATHISVPITTRVFGLPRVGNQAFANYVESVLPGLWHVTDDNDIVPRLPSTDFGYEHPSGEVFITQVGGSTYDLCPGQENYNCAIGIFFLEDSDSPHDGPYAGVRIGSDYCTA